MADFSVACVLYILRRLTLDMSAYPKLVAWLHDSLERPAAREHSRVQFIREKPPSALHRADQVQNVVFVPRRDRPPAGGRRLPSGGTSGESSPLRALAPNRKCLAGWGEIGGRGLS